MDHRFLVRSAEAIGPDIVRLVVEAPRVAAHARPGQFVIVRATDRGERIPLTICESDPESVPTGDTIRQLNDELVAHFAVNGCQTIENARTAVREILDRSDLNEWHIEVSPGGPGRPCASFGLDAPSHTVHLIPIPPPN